MKLDIADNENKGKTFHYEIDDEKSKMLRGKKIGDEIDGHVLDSKFKGFKFKITGLSNIAGFPALEKIEGIGLKKLLLTKKDKGMSGKRSKKHKKIKGLRLKKTLRGNTIAKDIVQVNLKVIEGKGLANILKKPASEEVNPEEKK